MTHLERGMFLVFLAIVSLGFAVLLFPFFTPILWAIVFAVIFSPVADWFTSVCGKRRLLGVSLTLACVFLLTLFLIFGIGTLVANEAIGLYNRLSSDETFTRVAQLGSLPLVDELTNTFGIKIEEVESRLIEIAQGLAGWLATQILSVGANAASFVLKFVLMLYLVFVFLYSGREMAGNIARVFPIEDRKLTFLFDRFAATVRALFRGTLIVALVQGVAGGILFAIAGIDEIFLWGVLMAIAALIPAVGPGIIWLPMGLVLLATGNLFGGVVVLLGGALFVGLLDNVLRPMLVGRDLEMSDALVMLSILSGLLTFGPSGIVIGPVLAAIFLAAWGLFEREYRD